MLTPLFGAFCVNETRFAPDFDGFSVHTVVFSVGNIDIHERSPVDAKEEVSLHGH